MPSTVKPRSLNCSCSFSSPVYCGVSPQKDATFTMSVTLPFCSPSVPGLPSSDESGRSYKDMNTPSKRGVREDRSLSGKLRFEQSNGVEIFDRARCSLGSSEPDLHLLPLRSHGHGFGSCHP